MYTQPCLLILILFCLLSSTISGKNCSCVFWGILAKGLLQFLSNWSSQDAVPACFIQFVINVCSCKHALLALASSRNCSWTLQLALKCSWCVPLQLPSPCYDSVHNPRVLHMQCVTCILPHLGLQITPGKVASQQTCVLLGYNFEPELASSTV